MLRQRHCSRGEVAAWEAGERQPQRLHQPHESAKWEKPKMRVRNTRQRKKECDKGNNSLFILIKKGSADITREISSPRSGVAVTCPALQCKDEGWRHFVSL